MENEEDINKYHDLVQEEIAYCLNCQPRDSGEYVWFRGVKSNLDDLFEYLEVPEKIREEVAEDLYCKNCGTPIQSGDVIGEYTPSEKALREKIDKWEKQYKKDLDDFSSFLKKYPYLGAEHPMGKKIIDSIKQTKKSVIKDREWYRARPIRSGKKMEKTDFMPPDPATVKIPEGRYNHYGQSHWYLSESKEGAARERLNNNDDESYVWIQKMKILSLNQVLDLTEYHDHGEDKDLPIVIAGIIYSETLEERVKHDSSWKPEYFVPRFVSDAAKESEFNGIVFTNSEHFHTNLVVFDINDAEYEFIEKPDTYEIPMKKDTTFEVNEVDLDI